MQDSHTAAPAAETTPDSSSLRLVSSSAAGLPGWLAGRVDEHLAAFAAHMTQGLLSRAGPVNLAAALRRHARDPARPLTTLGIALG